MKNEDVFTGKTLFLALALLLFAGAAHAKGYSWTGEGGDSRWETDANWSPATGHPANDDDNAQFKSDAAAVLGAGKTIAALYAGAPNEQAGCDVRLSAEGMPLSLTKGLYLGTASGKYLTGDLRLDGIGLRIGAPGAPADLQVGYSPWGREWIRSRFTQADGTFEGWVDDLYVSHIGGQGNARTNVLDLSGVEGGRLQVSSSVSVGSGQSAQDAEVLLGKGWQISLGTEEKPIPLTLLSAASTPGRKDVLWSQCSGRFAARLTTFTLATANVSGPRAYDRATMRLGPETQVDLVVSNLIVADGNDLSVTGRLDAASTSGGRLVVLSDLILGRQRNGQYRLAELLLGTNWSVRIGSPKRPDDATFSMGTIGMDKASSRYESLLRIAHGGTFEAYCTNFHVAGSPVNARYNRSASLLLPGLDRLRIKTRDLTIGELTRSTSTACSSFGTLDAGDAREIDLEAERLRVGSLTYPNAYRFEGEGVARFGRGTATIGDLVVGNGSRDDQPTGLLELNGTRMTVTNSFLAGKNGTIRVRVPGTPAGIDLAGGGEIPPVLDGRMEIAFIEPPEGFALATAGNANGVHWGLRWAGDHRQTVGEWLANGRLAWRADGLPVAMAEAIDVLYTPSLDATFVGFPVREVRPGTLLKLR